MRIYNTLSRAVEEFQPMNPPTVNMYCCGPTVYDYTHIGHLWKYTWDDVVRRTLTLMGYEVKHVMNITDVGHLVSDADEGEDKLEKGARKTGKTVWEVANYYTDYFNEAIRSMGISPPHMVCKATEHISQMIALIQTLEKRGYTYATDEAIYFDTSKFEGYGKLAGQKLNEKRQAVRAEVQTDAHKKNPHDFALWFRRVGRFQDHTMHWQSPWGDGFPGWHIECSAMSMHHLGPQLDIHTGGIDHISVHHPNEIAQSEGATGKKPFVKYWVHYNFVQIEGQKMSKSLENFITLNDIVSKGFHPHALRLLFLQSHYRSELNFTWNALEASQKALEKLQDAHAALPARINQHDSFHPMAQEVKEALAQDFNTAKALATVWSAVKDPALDVQTKRDVLDTANDVFGLALSKDDVENVPETVVSLAKKRAQAKKQGDFATADALRSQINEAGYDVKDGKVGAYTLHKK